MRIPARAWFHLKPTITPMPARSRRQHWNSAPVTTTQPVTLGATGGLSLADLTGITTTNLVIGAVTQPGGSRTTTAANVTVGDVGFDTTGVTTLELDATGAVTETAGLFDDSQLVGTAASFCRLLPGPMRSHRWASHRPPATSSSPTAACLLTLAANGASRTDFHAAAPTITLTGTVSLPMLSTCKLAARPRRCWRTQSSHRRNRRQPQQALPKRLAHQLASR